MGAMGATGVPPGHTSEGGVIVGSEGARRRMVVFEDPQCPYCREFEERSGDLLRREVAAGAIAVEYRIRSFLGEESVRAANALAVAAGAGRFDELRRDMFANQPPEHSGGFTTEDRLARPLLVVQGQSQTPIAADSCNASASSSRAGRPRRRRGCDRVTT